MSISVGKVSENSSKKSNLFYMNIKVQKGKWKLLKQLRRFTLQTFNCLKMNETYPRKIDSFNYLFAIYQFCHECRIIPQHFVVFLNLQCKAE